MYDRDSYAAGICVEDESRQRGRNEIIRSQRLQKMLDHEAAPLHNVACWGPFRLWKFDPKA